VDRVKKLYRLYRELKKRHMFVSLIVTNSNIQVSYWDGEKVVIGSEEDAWLHLWTAMENDRRELEWAANRLGIRVRKSGLTRA
jgi:hypothetical protein